MFRQSNQSTKSLTAPSIGRGGATASLFLAALCVALVVAAIVIGTHAPATAHAQDEIIISDLSIAAPELASARLINDYGEILGHVMDAGTWRHGLWNPVTGVTVFEDNFFPNFMNGVGQVAGFVFPPFPLGAGLWSRNDGLQDLGHPASVGGINDLGQVIGTFDGVAAVWRPGDGWTPIEAPGVSRTQLSDINNGGIVAGYGFDQGVSGGLATGRAFTWSADAGISVLELLDGSVGSATRLINDAGEVCGNSSFPDEASPAGFRWRPTFWSSAGQPFDIGTLGDDSAYIVGMNNLGHVAGWSYVEPGSLASRAFVWSIEDGIVDLGTLGGYNSNALGINDYGQVIGNSHAGDTDIYMAGFVWTAEDGMRELPTLGGEGSYVVAMNNVGQVLGNAPTADGETRWVLWTIPVPPSTPEEVVGDAAETIAALVESGVLSDGEANALNAKLDTALSKLEQGQIKPAINLMGALINQVEALERSGRLTEDAAAELITLATQAIELIEGI